jgi:hypothetical protein
MKEKIIEVAGKTWQFLGQNGETNVSALSKRLKEKNDVVLQSLGWLAREDKINYANRDKKTVVSLSDSEKRFFNSVTQRVQQSVKSN